MLKKQIQDDVKGAMKQGNQEVAGVLRMLLASITSKEKEKRYKVSKENPNLKEEELLEKSQLADEEIITTLSSEVKKRKDAIAVFARANRSELAEQEKKELNILESYLPAEISDEELSSEVKKAITESQAQSPADFGKAMKILAPLLKGKASGNRIADAVKNALSC